MAASFEEQLARLQAESARLDEKARAALEPAPLPPLQQTPRKTPRTKRQSARKQQQQQSAELAAAAQQKPPSSAGGSDPFDAASEGLSGDALERFLRARVRALREECAAHKAAEADAVKRAEAAETRAEQLATAAKELQGSSSAALARLERAEKARAAAASRCESLEAELVAARSKADAAAKEAKQTQREMSALEERLRVATVAAHAAAVEEERTAKTAAELERSRAECNRLAGDLRATAKQRDDLVAAVRAQAKLVDVLKRQKAHLESSKLLEISEAEFLRVLSAPTESPAAAAATGTARRTQRP